MFKNGIKNFFINLKHFFAPIGTLFLGIAMGLSIFIPCLVDAVSNATVEINNLLQELSVDFNAMWQSVVYSITEVNWNNPAEALQVVISKKWFSDTIATAANAALGENAQLFSESLPGIVANAANSIGAGLVALVAFTVIGILAGHALTSFLVRRTIAKRAFWKVFVAFVVDIVLSVTLVTLCVWLATIWTYSVIFTVTFVAILTAYKSLIEAYLVQGFTKVKFATIVNFKNALQHLLCVLVIWGIVVAVTLLVYLALNAVVAVAVGFAMVEIALAVCNLNAEAYVKESIK